MQSSARLAPRRRLTSRHDWPMCCRGRSGPVRVPSSSHHAAEEAPVELTERGTGITPEVITQCSIQRLYDGGEGTKDAVALAKEFERRKCGHFKARSESECLEHCIGTSVLPRAYTCGDSLTQGGAWLGHLVQGKRTSIAMWSRRKRWTFAARCAWSLARPSSLSTALSCCLRIPRRLQWPRRLRCVTCFACSQSTATQEIEVIHRSCTG